MKDCISALSIGIQAVCATGGASSIPYDISLLGLFRRCNLCLDNDGHGDAGTEQWINALITKFSR